MWGSSYRGTNGGSSFFCPLPVYVLALCFWLFRPRTFLVRFPVWLVVIEVATTGERSCPRIGLRNSDPKTLSNLGGSSIVMDSRSGAGGVRMGT
jgi:hypothetical protein